jgi:NhaP-type Na+/H+ or K+/H+ antiporter
MILIGVFILLLFLFGLVSRRAERSIITGPMVFTAAGILVALALPGLAKVEVDLKPVVTFAEVALALVLFTDATRIRLRTLLHETLPSRLLAIGMPLTIVAGVVAALLILPRLTLWEAAILATILAPTDAGLGQAVVHSPRVPVRIRQALNIEAGLNDGISLPFLMLFISLARADPGVGHWVWIGYTLQQIGFGILLGLAIGWLGGWLVHYASQRGWMTETFQDLSLLALALLAWGLAEASGGNGFLAAFTGGIFVKVGFEEASERMVEFIEAWGQLLSFGVFYISGMLMAPDLGHLGPAVVLYAALSLTLVRMLPVAVSMIGTKLKATSVLFLGWFGPRGLASVVLGLIYLKERADLPGEELIILAITATVLLSVLAHGVSAVPGTRWYAKQVEHMEPGAPELAAVTTS